MKHEDLAISTRIADLPIDVGSYLECLLKITSDFKCEPVELISNSKYSYLEHSKWLKNASRRLDDSLRDLALRWLLLNAMDESYRDSLPSVDERNKALKAIPYLNAADELVVLVLLEEYLTNHILVEFDGALYVAQRCMERLRALNFPEQSQNDADCFARVMKDYHQKIFDAHYYNRERLNKLREHRSDLLRIVYPINDAEAFKQIEARYSLATLMSDNAFSTAVEIRRQWRIQDTQRQFLYRDLLQETIDRGYGNDFIQEYIISLRETEQNLDNTVNQQFALFNSMLNLLEQSQKGPT